MIARDAEYRQHVEFATLLDEGGIREVPGLLQGGRRLGAARVQALEEDFASTARPSERRPKPAAHSLRARQLRMRSLKIDGSTPSARRRIAELPMIVFRWLVILRRTLSIGACGIGFSPRTIRVEAFSILPRPGARRETAVSTPRRRSENGLACALRGGAWRSGIRWRWWCK